MGAPSHALAPRILLIRLGAFGDVLRTLPAARGLRTQFPNAHLAWLVESASAPLLAKLPWIDEVMVFPRADLAAAFGSGHLGEGAKLLWRSRADMRASSFDWVIDFHGILKSGLLTALSGAPRRVGFAAPMAREGAALFYREHVHLPGVARSRFERNAALARHFGAQPAAAVEIGLATPFDPTAVSAGAAVIHPGTSARAAYKRYPVARFASVARALAGRLGRPCIVTAGPDPEEQALSMRLAEMAGPAAIVAPVLGDLDALVDLLSSARLFVSGDTGPLHLASLVGTPVVQVLGPTHPIENEPLGETPWARAQLPLPCGPCRRGCGEVQCLSLLPEQDVIAAANRVLAATEEGALMHAVSTHA